MGIVPSRGISLICQLYNELMSNKKIVGSSVIIDEKFRQANDSIMADCRFAIAKELEKIKIEPKNPCFLWW